MKKKSYNYKFIVGLIIGLLLVSGVSAASGILSSDVIYDSDNSSLSTGNVQGAIDDLANKIERPSSCPDGYYCAKYKKTVNDLELGDYVSYTPTIASFTTDTSKTNYTSTQTIYPNELKLWRVLNIYNDGTVDLISVYVSSTDVYFSNLLGYQNFVGYLNELASKYETEGITIRSRHFGYDEHNNPQTEYITDTQYFVNPAPWACSTGESCTPDPDDYEEYGGGDTGYLTDFNQVFSVLGTVVAPKTGTITAASYWMASRFYKYTSPSKYYWYGRIVGTNGIVSNASKYFYGLSSGSLGGGIEGAGNPLRPIVTLKSGLSYDGLGTKENPIVIKG